MLAFNIENVLTGDNTLVNVFGWTPMTALAFLYVCDVMLRIDPESPIVLCSKSEEAKYFTSDPRKGIELNKHMTFGLRKDVLRDLPFSYHDNRLQCGHYIVRC